MPLSAKPDRPHPPNSPPSPQNKATHAWWPKAADVYAHCACGIAVEDPASNLISFCNPAFARALGRTVDEVAGLPSREIYLPEDHAFVSERIAEADRTGTVQYDIRMRRQDGSLHTVTIDLVSVRDEQGKLAYRVASLRDISKQLTAIRVGQENEERFRLLFENSLDAVLETAPDGSVLAANPAACVLFGRTEAEICQHGRAGLVDLTDPRLPVMLAERSRSGRARGELRFVRPNGTSFVAEVSTSLYTNTHGERRGSTIIRDITERQQSAELERMQRALAVRLAKTTDLAEGLQACLDAALQATGIDSGGLYLIDEKSGALDLVQHRGLSPDFVQSTTHYPADSEQTRLIMAGRPVHARCAELNLPPSEAKGREGLQCISIVPFRDQDRIIGCLNAASHSLETIPDTARQALETIAANAGQAVTRLRTEAALRASEEKFRSFFELAADPVCIASLTGWFVEINAAFVRILGYSREELLRRPFLEFVHPDDRRRTQSVVAEQIQKGQTVLQFTNRYERKDGAIVWLEWVAQPVIDKGIMISLARDITARRQAEADLEQTRNTLLEAQRIAHLGSFEYVAATQSTVWSEEEYRIYGVDPAGRSPAYDIMLAKHIHPDDAALLHDTFIAAMRDSAIYELEHRIVRPDGSVRWVYDRAQPHFDENGKLLRYVGATLDITDRKQAEEALQRSEEKFAIAFANNPSAIAMTRLEDGRFLDVNRSWETMLGYQRNEIIGRSAREMHIWPSPEAAARFVASLKGSGTLHGWEQAFHRRSGEVFIAELSAQVLTVQGERVVLSTLIDITDRKHAEAALRESEANLREAQRVAKIGSWNLEVGSDRVTWSDELLRIFDLNRDAFGGTHAAFVARVHPDDRPAVLRTNERARSTGQPFDIEYRIVLSDRTIRYIREHGNATRAADGTVVRLFGTAQDITEQKVMEEHLMQAQRMEAIGNLAGGIAHDLNNILAPITLVSGLLNQRLTEDSDRELLALVQSGARRGAEIVKQLLTFSRGQAGDRIVVQPRHLIKEVMGLMRETFPREIDLYQQTPTDLWTVNADPTQLHQVLLNLCVNSRDAMPNGGHIAIAASNRTLAAGDPALLSGAPFGPYVVIEVADTGHGIPPEIRQRIFEPFFTTKPFGKGTGLGLSTVIGIVRSHGGFVIVDSEPGKGSTFRVYLPAITDGRDVATETPVTPTGPLASTVTVLLVEDEREVREATYRVLQQGGYRVLTAVNGADALTQFLQHRNEIRLVLTDLMMPVMNGVEFIRALQAIGAKAKIIAATGLADAAQTHEVAKLGVTELLPKPFTGEALLHALHRSLTAK